MLNRWTASAARGVVAALALPLFAFAPLAFAQTKAPPSAQETTVAGIVVEASPRTAKAARRYIDRIAGPPTLAISLAAWRTPICLEMNNLRPELAQALSDQIAVRASALGIKVLTSGCAANVTVIGTSDGPGTAASLVETFPESFKASPGWTQGDRQALRRFAERDAPVRWWTIAAQYDTETRSFVEGLWGQPPPPHDTTGTVFFNAHLARAMVKSIIVVDASRTSKSPAKAVGDYLAMVILAEMNPEIDTGAYLTVMNLWRPGGDVVGMTDWDQRYLKALYCAEAWQPGGGPPEISQAQRGNIARLMIDPPDGKHRKFGSACP